ncbi:hypothetical protein Rsub_09340 [Raphidocelis subcapitata]|uniref:Uncharacterized protein n=1 Tax=Raphidocelis subcapitata TaxID=307507 RepID=A0A2V0P9S0_9CHLO|nr:hypothetical protein Rsub_09340 [Raphidocelis subcapitata]|eukprot:GBF96594.1 hypothetical protein Rsub_09340 [Raphidocelis subcapitata]
MGAPASPRACPLRRVPVVPVALALGACITVGLWFGYMGKALAATKSAAHLMLMPVPPVMLTVPAVFLATLVATIVLSLAAVASSALRARAPPGAPPAPPSYLPAAGAVNALLFLLALWLAGTLAITALWAGAAMVSSKSTADAETTLQSVDPAIQRLIFQASGGAINGTESGFIVTVGQAKGATRDVDIGKSSCSLFCFVFARAMMSDSSDCYCDPPIMAKIHSLTRDALHSQLLPAAICAFAALCFVLGLLVCGAAQFGGAADARRAARGGGGRAFECPVVKAGGADGGQPLA